jgi:hypothetical protein
MTDITQDYLKETLDYDPETGVFVWKRRNISAFSSAAYPEREYPRWNTRYAGKEAGVPDRRGYIRVKLCGKRHAAHRLAWLWMTGSWPALDIDHANLNKSDNRWANLRLATRSENTANRPPANNNTTGLKGVYWHKANRKWTAAIGKGGANYLGSFDCPAAASIAYQIAADNFFGQFARVA